MGELGGSRKRVTSTKSGKERRMGRAQQAEEAPVLEERPEEVQGDGDGFEDAIEEEGTDRILGDASPPVAVPSTTTTSTSPPPSSTAAAGTTSPPFATPGVPSTETTPRHSPPVESPAATPATPTRTRPSLARELAAPSTRHVSHPPGVSFGVPMPFVPATSSRQPTSPSSSSPRPGTSPPPSPFAGSGARSTNSGGPQRSQTKS